MAIPPVTSRVPPTLPELDDFTDSVLLDTGCYIADLPNATTATGATRSGLPIQVTLRAARPPLLSHFCVHCPGLEFIRSSPRIIATDADLALLRVPVDPFLCGSKEYWDYFVYSPRARRLDLLPNPDPRTFNDCATALLSRGDGGAYAIAALDYLPPVYSCKDGGAVVRWPFDLHLYRSSHPRRWTSKRMSVNKFVRDRLVPLPHAVADDMLYHYTGKTITISAERGTVAWVDLWRGIFTCNVLDERPVLHDIPLPEPARGNWERLLKQRNPNLVRDVAISRDKGSLKYIEMESRNMKDPPGSYREWAHCDGPSNSKVISGNWKATIWSIAMPAGSWTDWRCEGQVDFKDFTMDATDPRHSDVLYKLSDSGTMPTLQELPMVYPSIGMDGDVVYMLSRNNPKNMKKLEMVIAVDVRKGTVQGVAELDAQKNFIFMPTFFTSGISRYLRKATGTEALKHTKKDASKPTENEEVKSTEQHVKKLDSKKVWRRRHV